MTGWLPALLLAGTVLSAAPAREVPGRDPPVRHDFHVSYTRMAIEPTVITAQIRMFTDDVTRALVERSRTPALVLASKAAEAAFQSYLAEMFPVSVNGRRLAPVVVSGGADGQMWAFIVTWTSAAPITAVSMHNATMFELFDDQQNIVKLKHLGSGKEATQFFSGGSRADQVFRF
ncbi:MAG: hypothetical protein IT355_17095 [Gemmatimonadaceae bacterium]|nr:hypothetical protein [Gemmatimonadaceae bacterium]